MPHLLVVTFLTTLFCLFTVVTPVHAQTSVDEIQQWSSVTVSGAIKPNSPWRTSVEVQPRFGRENDLTQFNRLFIHPAVGYQINKHVSVWQGYTWAPIANTQTGDIRYENRLFQQVVLENNWHKLNGRLRYRIEERFAEGAEGAEGVTGVRLRQLLRGQIPLSKDKKWAVVVYDELFMGINKMPTVQSAGYDQNRLFIGINKKLTPKLTLESGYLLNHVNRPNRNNQLNHVILIQLNYKW